VFVRGAQELNTDPSCCVVFEDAQAGIEAAIAGGMKCVGVGDPKMLAKADMVIPDLRKITIRKLKNL
jgi:beta-phosphoglucomutase